MFDKLPSGSRLSLAMKCAGSALLPQVKSEPNAAAEKGTNTHALLAEFFAAGCVSPETHGEGARETCKRLVDCIGPLPGLLYPELGISLDPNGWIPGIFRGIDSLVSSETLPAARVDLLYARQFVLCDSNGVPVRIGDVGSISESERAVRFVAVADLVRWDRADGSIHIYDWKTGSSWIPDPEWNWQLLLPAIAIGLSAAGADIQHRPKYVLHVVKQSDSGVWSDVQFECNQELLRTRFQSIKWLYKTLVSKDASSVALYEGKHCVFCPARDRCPAKIGAMGMALRLMTGMDVDDREHMMALLALDETGAGRSKTKIEILERNGGLMDLKDGREAVLVDNDGKKKVYTRRKK